mmetsp:Transcript_9763/g.16006  ORF Transcript_9763/g.16006 Transcript_9763/m.16006 type:complete len:207 (+) Transcript_9763:341-961(+)
MLFTPLIKSVAEEKVSLDTGTKDKRDLGLVISISQDFGGNLHDGCDTSSSGNHVEVGGVAFLMFLEEMSISVVVKLSNRSSHVDGVTNLEGVKVLRELSSEWEPLTWWVGLDDELHTANIMVRGDGSVTTHDHLTLDIPREEDVLSSRKTKHVLRRLKSKVKFERVTGQDGLLLKLKCLLMLGIQCNLPSSLLTDALLYFILLGNR